VTLSAREKAELLALVLQAWPYRHGPYARDAAEAIVDWHETLPLRRLERTLERAAAESKRQRTDLDELAELLRRTDPNSVRESRRAA
jgi:hypothetical protein